MLGHIGMRLPPAITSMCMTTRVSWARQTKAKITLAVRNPLLLAPMRERSHFRSSLVKLSAQAIDLRRSS